MLAILGTGVWLTRKAIVTHVEQRVVARLAEEGIHLHYGDRTWSFGRGLHLENVVLVRAANDDRPVVEISALTIGAPLLEILGTRDLISTWRMRDATLTLHDETGSLTFRHVTTHLVARAGSLEIRTLQGRHDTLAINLPGRIALPAPEEKTRRSPGPFLLDLSTVRDVLGTLAIQPSTQTFHLRGHWSLALADRQNPVWKADLVGVGSAMEWQGLPLRKVEVKGQVTQAGLDLATAFQLPTGSAQVSLSRADWESAPLVLAGTLTDGKGASDEFAGRYDIAGQNLVLNRLAGKADLIGLARNIPALASQLPDAVTVAKFPELEMRNFSATFADGATRDWQVGDLQVRGPASLSVFVGADPMQIAIVEGRASFLDRTWKVQARTSSLEWRDVRTREAKVEATLKGGILKSTVTAQLPRGSVDLVLSSDDFQREPLEISGSLKDSRGRADRIAVSYFPRTSAWQLAKLDGAADLLEWAANFPSLPPLLPPTVNLRSAFPEIAVRDFSYRPGRPVSIGLLKIVGVADLTVTLQKGRAVPIDKLTGQAAFDGRAWKLSRLGGRLWGGQASVDGIYENGTLRDATLSTSRIQLAQIKSWLGGTQDSLGEAVLSFDYRGSLSVENPGRVTGSGHLRLDNAPVVKIPLLDQTYALFSVLSSPIQRRGNGSLDATFSTDGGMVHVSQFTARSDAARVTATGTIDLKKRVVEARARGNIRGIFGLATSPLSRVLEMQVSGPLDRLRVRPLGFDNILTGTLAGTAEILPSAAKRSTRFTSDIVRDGIALPLRAFDFLTPEGEGKR